MPAPDPRTDVHTRIQNAIARLTDPSAATPAQAVHSLKLAVRTLEEARAAILDRERELEALTDPELDAAKEVLALRQELERAGGQKAQLERELFDARTEAQVQQAMAAEDDRQRRDLEKRMRDFDRKLMTDDDAFSKFMDSAMDDMPDPDER